MRYRWLTGLSLLVFAFSYSFFRFEEQNFEKKTLEGQSLQTVESKALSIYQDDGAYSTDTTNRNTTQHDDDIVLRNASRTKQLLEPRKNKIWYTCDQKRLTEQEITSEEKIDSANCGAGFEHEYLSGEDVPIKIALFGEAWRRYWKLSGCPKGVGKCPFYPKCSFYQTASVSELEEANITILLGREKEGTNESIIRSISQMIEKQTFRMYRVLYWREPYWYTPEAVQKWFDFELGVHYWSAQVSPIFLRTPEQLLESKLNRFIPFEQRTSFAMSMISSCHANSKRKEYIQELAEILGETRMHQYGSCGDGHELPPPPMINAVDTIGKYKFYFAMENTLVEGYVSEKLMVALSIGVIPVYLGAPDVLNITHRRSFINILNYNSPAELAKHLLHLAQNKTAYMEYHKWRFEDSRPVFHSDYLNLLSDQKPSKNLIKVLMQSKEKFGLKKDRRAYHPERRLSCCKLCSLSWVRKSVAQSQHLPIEKRKYGRKGWKGKSLLKHLGLN